MVFRRFVLVVVFLSSLSIIYNTVNATPLNSNQEIDESDTIAKQHCQTNQTICQEIPDYLVLPESASESSTSNYTDLCCRLIALDSGLLTLDLILNDFSFVKAADEEDWSVLSSLAEEEEADNKVQNEIDLLEVEEIESAGEIEGAESKDQTYTQGGPHQQYKNIYFFNQVLGKPGLGSFLDSYTKDVRIDIFSVLNRETCNKDISPGTFQSEDNYAIPEIPVYSNKKIQAFIHLYSKKKRDVFVKAIERMPEYQEMITRILVEHELPLNLAYLAVVESNLNPNARSRANAVGLWQFMSYTGKHFGLSNSWWHDDRYDPEKSTKSAAKYLKQLHGQFNGDWELALAAYNSGSGTVRRAIRRAKANGKSSDFWSLRLPRETRGYVPAFYAVATIFADLEKYQFNQLEPAKPTQPKQLLDVGGGISLNQLAKVLGLNHDELAEINPRLRFRGLTPPTYDSFNIALPASIEVTDAHLDQLEELKKNRHEEWKIHKVRQGETLWSISRSYRIPLDKILAYNRIQKKGLLRIGQKLMLPVPTDWNPPQIPSKTKMAVLDMDKIPGVTKIHVVQKGETLWQISQKYNIPINKIRQWNRRVLNRKYLKIGTEIVLKLPVTVASKSF